MLRVRNIGIDLQDETKELSKDNKIVSFYLFGECPKCKKERELTAEMFTDSCIDSNGRWFTGWQYKCDCGHIMQIWEGAFDGIIDSCYEADLVVIRE